MRPNKYSPTAAVAWILAAAAYVVAEAISASAFPGYSYATNYISDLGVPDVGPFQGRVIDSPLHLVMNAAFVLHGVLFAVAGVLVTAGRRTAAARWFRVLAVVHGVGMVLVGSFHGSQSAVESGLVVLHVAGAALAILGGNAAAVVAGTALLRGAGGAGREPGTRRGVAGWIGTASVVLGVAGVVGLVMLEVDSGSSSIDLLPEGVWERVAVYAVLAWDLLAGGTLLVTKRRDAEALA
jgi:hypothetical membrane protein